MRKSVLFVTSNSLATNPRLVKEIRSCLDAGHQVTVVSFAFQNWSKPLNEALLQEFESRVHLVLLAGDRSHKRAWLTSTFINLSARCLAVFFPRNLLLASFCFSKRSWLLQRSLKKLQTNYDSVIAHNPGAFVPAYAFAAKNNVSLGIDMEDFHPGETFNTVASQKMEMLMRQILEKANVMTAASPLILEQTLELLKSRKPAHCVINNVFSLQQQPAFLEMPDVPLKLIWFSQTVGLNRGIQDVIQAMNQIENFPVHLTLLGFCTPEVKEGLEILLRNDLHELHFCPPAEEKVLISICSQHHIGLALETGEPLNRNLCLTNKIFIYLLAGNAIIASQTAAQERFLNEYPFVGKTYPAGDWQSIAVLLDEFARAPQSLLMTRSQAYRLAKTELNWEIEVKKLFAIYRLNGETTEEFSFKSEVGEKH